MHPILRTRQPLAAFSASLPRALFLSVQHRLSTKASSTTVTFVSASNHTSTFSIKRHVAVKDLTVSPDESGMRLDRFLRYRLSREQDFRAQEINNTVINKWLRKRQVKLIVPVTNDASLASNADQGHVAISCAKCQDTDKDKDKDAPTKNTKDQSAGLLKAITVTTGTTRTEAGQTWRLRLVLETSSEASDATTTTLTAATAIPSGSGLKNSITKTTKTLLPLSNWVIYKDERIIVLDKPAGVAVQGGTGVQDSIDGSLSALQDTYPDRPRLVHRLDKTTSGLLILARTRKAAQDLTRRFRDGTTGAAVENMDRNAGLEKMYIAIVGSTESRPVQGRNCIYGSDEGAKSRLTGNMVIVKQGKQEWIQVSKDIAKPRPELGSQATSGSGPPEPGPGLGSVVWPSVTDYCIASQSFHDGVHWSALQLYPKTGRKHQLRVHCAQLLKAPILGDNKYGKDMDKEMGTLDRTGRIHLHMAKVTLKGWIKDDSHVDTVGHQQGNQGDYRVLDDGTLVVRAPIPQDMNLSMQRLGLILHE